MVESVAKSKGILNILNGTTVRPNDVTAIEWDKHDGFLEQLITGTTSKLYSHIATIKGAANKYAEVVRIASQFDASSKHALLGQLWKLKWERGWTCDVFWSKVNDLKAKIQTAGGAVDDLMLTNKILSEVPKEYEVQRTIRNCHEEPNLRDN